MSHFFLFFGTRSANQQSACHFSSTTTTTKHHFTIIEKEKMTQKWAIYQVVYQIPVSMVALAKLAELANVQRVLRELDAQRPLAIRLWLWAEKRDAVSMWISFCSRARLLLFSGGQIWRIRGMKLGCPFWLFWFIIDNFFGDYRGRRPWLGSWLGCKAI